MRRKQSAILAVVLGGAVTAGAHAATILVALPATTTSSADLALLHLVDAQPWRSLSDEYALPHVCGALPDRSGAAHLASAPPLISTLSLALSALLLVGAYRVPRATFQVAGGGLPGVRQSTELGGQELGGQVHGAGLVASDVRAPLQLDSLSPQMLCQTWIVATPSRDLDKLIPTRAPRGPPVPTTQ